MTHLYWKCSCPDYNVHPAYLHGYCPRCRTKNPSILAQPMNEQDTRVARAKQDAANSSPNSLIMRVFREGTLKAHERFEYGTLHQFVYRLGAIKITTNFHGLYLTIDPIRKYVILPIYHPLAGALFSFGRSLRNTTDLFLELWNHPNTISRQFTVSDDLALKIGLSPLRLKGPGLTADNISLIRYICDPGKMIGYLVMENYEILSPHGTILFVWDDRNDCWYPD